MCPTAYNTSIPRPLPSTPVNLPPLAMPIAPTEPAYNISPTKRSPTQRHMHNYSLPSPTFASRATNPLPTRCKSSPTLSEFRKAVYIPHTIGETMCLGAREPVRLPSKPSRTTRPVQLGGTLDALNTASLRTAASDPGISLLAYMNDEEPNSVSHSPALSGFQTRVSGCSSPSNSPSSSPSPRRPSTSPSRPMKQKPDGLKVNRYSTTPMTSLPFPLPPPPGLTSHFEWEIDPFACPSSPSATNHLSQLPESKWSPASSTLSLAHQPDSPRTSPKTQTTFERLKGDIPSPTKLKHFFGRLSISRSPTSITASGSHFRSASVSKHGETQGHQVARRDSLVTFVIADEKKMDGADSLIENTKYAHNDGADNLGTPIRCRVSHAFHAGHQDLSSVLPDTLRLEKGEINRNDVQFPAFVSQTPISTETSPMSCRTSIVQPVDVDGIAVTEYSSISASIQIPLAAESLYASLHPPLTMRIPVPDAPTGSPNLPPSLASPANLYNSRINLHFDPSRALPIPPSPRIPPPNPPHPPPGSDSVASVRDTGFPLPPILAQYSFSSTPSSGGEASMERRIPAVPPSPSRRRLPRLPPSLEIAPVQNPYSLVGDGSSDAVVGPPAIPPRSRLRPPPVKITTDFSEIRHTILTKHEDSEQPDALSLEGTTIAHSRSSSIASLIISPLSPPPLHSRSSSTASIVVSPMPIRPQHSHSASISSSFMISPMPTPPPLSPTSPSSISELALPPLALPTIRPRESQLDMSALRALILLRSGRAPSECGSDHDSEIEDFLEAFARSSDDRDDSSTYTLTTPEFSWQEETRPPPSRLSFYESVEPTHPSSDPEEEDQDDAASIYSQFSAAYTFRSLSRSTKRMRSLRRNGTKGRMSRRMATTSMMSVYSQASFSSQDVMDLPPMPTLPWSLGGDLNEDVPEESLSEHGLGDMTFNAPEYAYAYSLDDYVGHSLEAIALAGGTAPRSGADFEARLPWTPRHNSGPSTSRDTDDWRALLTAQDKGKGKRRTSSNISVVGNVFAPDIDPEVSTRPATGLAPLSDDAGSLATNGSVGDISTTSTVAPMSLVPNRRQRTIRRVATSLPSSPRSNYQPPSSTSVNFIFDTETGNGEWRREMPLGESVPFPSLGPEEMNLKKARGMRSGLRGMRSRVSVLKNRLVSLSLAPRSPSSPSFANAAEFHPGPKPYLSPYPPSPSVTAHWPPTSVSPSVASSSSSSGGSASVETSTPSSASSWTPGLITGDGFLLSPVAAPTTFAMAI
ncbi:hypothetical protein DFH09DRAFT_318041 [Mycena vulgaris]|nr:hypothetical protein DFH09DRAFT_318041 [Mycena vulgaris]